VPHDLPVIVVPGAILPVGATRAKRYVLATAGQMLFAIEPKARPMPDVANRVGVDIAHAGIGGNVVTAHHHIAPAVDVQPFEDERARHLVGIEIGARIGGPAGIERGIDAPGEKLALDEVVDPYFPDPIALDGVDVDAVLVHSGRYHLGRAPHLVA